jgi:ribosomal protein S18 acetylase RimI-like enzyme
VARTATIAGVQIRPATLDDMPLLDALYRAFESELWPTVPEAHLDEEVEEVRELVGGAGLGFVAEDASGEALGFVLARRLAGSRARVTDLYVRPDARQRGVGEALTRAVVDAYAGDGVDELQVEVAPGNARARNVYERWGFREELVQLVVSLPALAARIGADAQDAGGESYGSIHVQTDDVDAVVRAVEIYVPRLPGRSRGSVVTQPRNGYVTVFDDVCDRDPAALRRLAREISTRTGLVVIALGVEQGAVARMILFDRGGIVDEYASVPEFHGPLPPGEVVALAANPVVVERYTGAAQEDVRAATPTAGSPGELPPARELVAGLAQTFRLDGAAAGWADARDLPGAVRLDR